jgi:hypothetical protein
MPDDPAPETGQSKAKVFISYSRKDIDFTNRLDAALRARGFEPLIDIAELAKKGGYARTAIDSSAVLSSVGVRKLRSQRFPRPGLSFEFHGWISGDKLRFDFDPDHKQNMIALSPAPPLGDPT